MRVEPREPKGQECVLEAPGGKGTGLPTPQRPSSVDAFQAQGWLRPMRGCLRHCVEKDSETTGKTCCLAVSTLGEGGDNGCPRGIPHL